MVDFIVAVICLLLALVVIALSKVYFGVPLYELRRRALKGEAFASTIYPVAAFGPALRATFWLLLALFSAVALVLMARLAPTWLGFCLVIGWIWLAYAWLPNAKHSALTRRVTLSLNPLINRLAHFGYPLIKNTARVTGFPGETHTGMYETEDLLGVLERQERQLDNRIDPRQLSRLKQVIAFEQTKAGKFVIPWSKVMKLNPDDPIGPKLLDEMHHTKQLAFPVCRDKAGKIVEGILLKDALGLSSGGYVKDHMSARVGWLNRNQPMEAALAKFALELQPLLIVTGKNKEILGILTLKDALGSLLAVETSKANETKLFMEPIRGDLIKEGDDNESIEQ
jgi:CBS domain containing-hemolysin-like protein